MIKLRNLKRSDFRDILAWRNDLESRNNAITKKKIGIKEHKEWAERLIKNEKNKLFIALSKNFKVGFIRYEHGYYGNFLVSIHLNQEFRNSGLGHKLLKLTQEDHQIFNQKKKLFAKINKDNLRSIKTFKKANYSLFKECKMYYVYINDNFKNNKSMKKNNNKERYYLKIINDIQKIRSKNNGNWMDILRIAFKHSPEEAAKSMARIYEDDQKISKLAKKLSNKK